MGADGDAQHRPRGAGDPVPRRVGGAVGDAGRRAPCRAALGRGDPERGGRLFFLSRRSVTAGTGSSPGTGQPAAGKHPVSLDEVRARDPSGARHRLRHARPPVDVPVPQRRTDGPAYRVGRVLLAATPPTSIPRRRAGHEHEHSGRRQPGLEYSKNGSDWRTRYTTR